MATDKLATVIGLAERAAEQAALALAAARAEAETCSAQLDMLRQARAQYVGALGDAAGGTVAQMRRLHHFLAQVDRAIAELERNLSQRNEECERRRLAWVGERQRARALGRVSERRGRAERRTALAREQAEVDDRYPRR